MGGHGALTLYLASKTKQYRSASAFAPISNPVKAPWGIKAFGGYLQGGVDEALDKYDATALISKTTDPVHILVDYVRIWDASLRPKNFSVIYYRVLQTTFTNKGSYCQRTS